MNLTHDNYKWNAGLDGVAYKTDWGVFYAAKTLLVYPASYEGEIDLKFSIPDHWNLTTPWFEIEKQSFNAC